MTKDEEIAELKQTIAAEREKREAQGRAYERLKASHAGAQTSLLNAAELLQKQLDAERKQRKLTGDAFDMCHNQLLELQKKYDELNKSKSA